MKLLRTIDEEADPSPGLHSAWPLTTLLGLLPTAEIDLLGDSTAESYWERSNRVDIVLDLTTGQRGLMAPRYLLLAMSTDDVLRLKPQNLIAGLLIRQVEAVN